MRDNDRWEDWEVELPNVYRRPRRKRRQGKEWSFLFLVVVLLSMILCLGRGLLSIQERLEQPIGGSGSHVPLTEEEEPLARENTDPTEGDRLDYILNHPRDYPEELRELAEKNEEALDYVYQYPVLKDTQPEIDLSDEARSDTVPLLIQWDARWGYLDYGDGLIGYTGCAPTCLSMVALYLTGDETVTPAAVAAYADRNGYYIDGSGTDWSMLRTGCEAFGLRATELSLNENNMIRALEAGQPIICSMRAGDFTDGGHFIVITGYKNGAFTVNDPNSRVRSGQSWTYERLQSQIKNLWAYSAQ